jgi:hypothetical protein
MLKKYVDFLTRQGTVRLKITPVLPNLQGSDPLFTDEPLSSTL